MAPLEKQLERWLSAGVVDSTTAARIRAFEQSQVPSERLRWPVLLALALGGALLCAGILLLVAADWDELTPASAFRFGSLLADAVPAAGALAAAGFQALQASLYASRVSA